MDRLVTVYDSCVLYPAPLRDLLMHLALTDLFQAKWTESIHQEWMKNVLADRPDLTLTQLQRTRELMDKHIRDCIVTGYENLIPTLSLPDSNDHHVLAAAICAQASVIVTYNLKDFPSKATSTYGIEAWHPDDFISYLIEIAPGAVCTAVQKLRATLKNPIIEIKRYLEILERQSLPRTVAKLKEFSELL
jgi:predicted nucleic acid-binding protein